MNDRENDTMRENEGRQVQQELENQLRAFGDTVSDAFAHGFEGKGEDIGDRAYGVGRAAVNAANFGLGEAAKAFRSRREEYYRSRQNAQNTKQGLNEDNINAQAAGVSGWFRQMFGKAETTPADEIRASAKKRYSAGCALLAVGITFTVIFGITAVSCLGAAGLFTPNAAVLQALLQDSFMAEKWAKDETLTVKEALSSQISIIGENMNIRRVRVDDHCRCVPPEGQQDAAPSGRGSRRL